MLASSVTAEAQPAWTARGLSCEVGVVPEGAAIAVAAKASAAELENFIVKEEGGLDTAT